MKYPRLQLDQVEPHYLLADDPLNPQAANFLEINKSPQEVRIKVDRFSFYPN